ncbi:hypothetical protein ACNPQM_41515 [Streptomyces sp. NPDC056231]|uniref:hypothetical protein n=1 Tax=Streptomyces sp. NPDC056231 TaxID=3345755 RepID=UPI003AAF8846
MSRPIRSLSALVGSAVLVAVVPALPAAADTAATGSVVTFDSIVSGSDEAGTVTPGQTVSGEAEVTFSVQADPTDEPYAAVVSITGHTDAQGTGTVSRRFDLASGDCLPSCTLHAVLDTTATQPFGGSNAVAVPLVDDGANSIRIDVYSARPAIVSAATSVTVNNKRPVVSVPDLPGEDAWTNYKPVGLTADQQLALRVAAADGGAGVSRVEYFSSHPAWPAPSDLSDGDGDGVWAGAVDTSAVKAGLWLDEYVVAFDSKGRAGTPVRLTTLVDHGFTVTPQIESAIHNNAGPVKLNYSYPSGLAQPWPRNLNYAYPVSTQVMLDGRPLGTTPVGDYTYEGNQSGFYARVGSGPLPYGAHTLMFDVTDNRGAHGRTAVPVTVVSPVEPKWTAGFDALPVAGKTWKAAATTSAADGFSRAQSWTLAVDGATIATGAYPALPSGSWTASKPGLHQVTLTTVSQFGDSTVTTKPLRVLAATATKLSGPALSTYGGKQAFTATVTQTGGKPAGGAQVTLQFRSAGATAWSTVAVGTADGTGTARFTTTAKRNGSWRAVASAKQLTWAASTSSSLTNKVTAQLTVKSPTISTRHGRTVAYTAVSSPYVSGTKLQFQIRKSDGSWTTVAGATLGTNGTAVGKVTFSRSGTFVLRVYRPATSALAASYSSVWTVRVS